MVSIKLLILLLIFSYFEAYATITNYSSIFIPVCVNKQLLVAIRSYNLNDRLYFLLVDPYNLKTYQKAFDEVEYRYHSYSEIIKTPYYRALEKFKLPPYDAEGYGLKRGDHKVDGMFLTIDMCPSKHKFEKEFFEYLSNFRKVPITIAVSGLWISAHELEFEWLVKQDNLDITWVNHSFSHPYYLDVSSLDKNFLNIARTNVEQEILLTEQMLLKHGLIPSIFFRFPGLVANKNLVELVNDFGLIPLSADAWLARGDLPTNGSIILVHGNSNEHNGIEIFMKLPKNIKYLPLGEALS